MPPARHNASVINANSTLDEAQTLTKALNSGMRTINDAKTTLYRNGWLPAISGEVTLELLAKILFAVALDTNRFSLTSTNIITAVAFLITEQIGSLTKANIVSGVTQQLLDTLIPITTNFETKIEQHLKAITDSAITYTNFAEKLQLTQDRLRETTENVSANTKSHADLNDKLQKTQEKLDETSLKVSTTARTYSQAAATPPAPYPTHLPPPQTNTSLAQMQMRNRIEIKRRQVLIDFEKTEELSLDNLDERTLMRKATDAIITVWASTPEPKPLHPTLKAATLLRNGGLLLEIDSSEAADWLRTRENRDRLLTNMGLGACIKDRTYQVILQFVPTQFDPTNNLQMRLIEEQNGIAPNTILKAEWIKPVGDRRPDQKFATLRAFHRDPGSANKILSSGACILGKRTVPKKPKREPIRCLFCQKYGHERRACRSEQPRCGRCSQAHETNECTAQKEEMRCANCHDSHPSYDRFCPNFLDKCKQMDSRRPENNLAFYPTGENWTWATIDQDTRTDPPTPPQVQPRRPGTTPTFHQSRLTGANNTPIGPPTTNARQQPHQGPSQ
jgi:hypothetical protein